MKRVYMPFLGLALLVGGCELTEVTNPYVTEDRFLETSQSVETWMNGSRRQMSATVGTIVEFTELVSDNYFNNYTGSSKVFDIPQIQHFDLDVTRIQRSIHRLKENTRFGLERVLPSDAESTALHRAELLLYSAYSHILAADYFVGMPAEELGEVLTPAQHVALALADLNEAESLFTSRSDQLTCALLKARAYYMIGDASNAALEAERVLEMPLLNRQVHFGTQTGPSNSLQSAVFSATTNQFAPLPRLDFLDPKYFNLTPVPADDQKSISISKAEEAYLIIAEAQASQNQLDQARQTLIKLLAESVAKRPVIALDDSRETRNGGNRGDYPLTAMKVKFDASGEEKEGLILNRKAGKIQAYPVTGTHVTAAYVSAAETQDELLYLIYLLRQEIFFSEGRRMVDLGIRFPVSQLEEQNNPKVRAEHTQAQIPFFIPVGQAMDDFTVDVQSGVVTMKHDMNKVLVANKTSREIMPFIN